MKQLYYDVIGEYFWSKKHNEKSKHPDERLDEFGIKRIISIPESIADCWNCLIYDFEGELPDYIKIGDKINWDYFYHYKPDICIKAMKECGIDYPYDINNKN